MLKTDLYSAIKSEDSEALDKCRTTTYEVFNANKASNVRMSVENN